VILSYYQTKWRQREIDDAYVDRVVSRMEGIYFALHNARVAFAAEAKGA
jgi:hypothetical protein